MDCCKIGRHINLSRGLHTVPQHAKSIGCNIFQIFLGSPQLTLSKKRTDDELINLRSELEKYNMQMVIHGSYTINLCHKSSSTKYINSQKSLVQDLLASEKIGQQCLGVIIHMGKNVEEIGIDDDTAINNYIRGVSDAINSTTTATIILETGASQGNEVGSSMKDLCKIYNRISESHRSRVKICIDTCHIWASGYDISNKNSVKNFFEHFNKLIGIKNISCIHFNDSRTNLNSNIDRHADLGYGYIGDNGLKFVAQFAKKHNIPVIMETPLDAVNPKTNKNISSIDEMTKVTQWFYK